MDLSLGVELCWPYRPNEKGSVESLVRWVKGSFFKQRRFLDEEDLRAQLAQWLVEVNTKVPSRATGVVPEERLREECEWSSQVTPAWSANVTPPSEVAFGPERAATRGRGRARRRPPSHSGGP